MTKSNIILIMTDQQRYDSIAAFGNSYMITPVLDRLSAQGTVFTNCFCTAPSCVPSRASLFNCQYPGRLGVFRNGDRWQHSWVQQLQAEGYHCVNVGKMHTVPLDATCGFNQRFIVENKDRGSGKGINKYLDEWNRYLLYSGIEQPTRDYYKHKHPLYETALGAYQWELDEKYHPDVFVGTMAKSIIKNLTANAPLFLQIGFPGPHPPYDPPEDYTNLYRSVNIRVEPASEEEKAAQPNAQKIYRKEMITGNHDGVRWSENPTMEQLVRLRKFYAANVTLIDKQIGGILEILEEKGFLKNAIIVFTSDHGDCLGDHGHIQKWTMYDSVVRIPMILWSSEPNAYSGRQYDALIQQFDVAHTLLSMAGITPSMPFQSISLHDSFKTGRSIGREFVFAEHARCNVMNGAGFISMIRDRNYKLVHYLNDDYGELYDLRNNPMESVNLWNNIEYEQVKQGLLLALLNYRCSLPKEIQL